MIMEQLQLKLSRIVRDLDEIASELNWRRFPYDCEKADQATALVGQICQAFLDEEEQEKLDDILNCVGNRPEPFTIGIPTADELDELQSASIDRVLKMNKKTRVVARTVKNESGGKTTVLKIVPRKPAKKKRAA